MENVKLFCGTALVNKIRKKPLYAGHNIIPFLNMQKLLNSDSCANLTRCSKFSDTRLKCHTDLQ